MNPSASPSPAGDLIHITGDPKILAIGAVFLLAIGIWILLRAHRDDPRPGPDNWS
jgi:hypothetical protein